MFDFDSGSQAHAVAEPIIEEIAGPCAKGPVVSCRKCPSRAVGLCRDFEAGEGDRFFRTSSRVSYPRDHEIIRQCGPSRRVLTVVTGALMLRRVAPDGRCFVIDFVWPGDVIGLYKEENSAFSVVTLRPTELCGHTHAELDAVTAHSLVLTHRLLLRERAELAAAREHTVLLGSANARERVAYFLLRMQERQGRLERRISPRVDLPMRRADIAAYLSLTPETISRIFQDFARRKIIVTVPNGVRILAREALVAIGEAAPQNVWFSAHA